MTILSVENLKNLNADLIYKSLYGAVKKIINDKEQLELTVSSQTQVINDLTATLQSLVLRIEALENRT